MRSNAYKELAESKVDGHMGVGRRTSANQSRKPYPAVLPGRLGLLSATVLHLLVGALVFLPGIVRAAGAANDHTVLILGTTALKGPTSPEAIEAGKLGMAVEIVDGVGWKAKSQADFATYRALVFGDPGDPVVDQSPAPVAAGEANRTTWSPIVTGNVIVVGNDPSYHYQIEGRPGAVAEISNGMRFATDTPGKTGAYISLSCYYANSPGSTIPLLDQFGTFKTVGAPNTCYDNAHIVAVHPALAGLTDVLLSDWNCSVHELLTVYPTGFLPLVIARNATGPGSQSFADGSFGIPFFIARGSALQPVGLNIVKAGPATAQLGDTITYTITYGNTGETGALGTVITDPVPAGTTFLSATDDGTASAGVVSWNIGGLATGVSGKTVQFSVRVIGGTSIINTGYKIQSTGVPAVTGSDVVTTIPCLAPGTPVNLTIAPKNPAFSGAPPTGTDTLVLSWAAGPGQAPTRYAYRLNGDSWTSTTATSVEVGQRKNVTPIQLNVQAFACSPEVGSPVATSATASLAKPGADFAMPATAGLNVPVTLTDSSNPQATSWLWIYADGTRDTSQPQSHSFTASGSQQVALIASNGSGTDVKVKSITIAASVVTQAASENVRRFDTRDDGRQVLEGVRIETPESTWLHVTSLSAEPATIYLHFVGENGATLLERRLELEAFSNGKYDLAAYGLKGKYKLEAVSTAALVAWVAEEGESGAVGVVKRR